MTLSVDIRQEAKVIDLAQTIIKRIQCGLLTQVSILHLNQLPSASGVYFATTEGGEILYIGKAKNLKQRCKISQHHKLPLAVELGVTVIQIARVDNELAWAVEQKLIAEMRPRLNGSKCGKSKANSLTEKRSKLGNLNPGCPKCGKPGCKNGENKSGTQRYRCWECRLSYTPGRPKGGIGRPTIGHVPMSSTERSRRQRAKEGSLKPWDRNFAAREPS